MKPVNILLFVNNNECPEFEKLKEYINYVKKNSKSDNLRYLSNSEAEIFFTDTKLFRLNITFDTRDWCLQAQKNYIFCHLLDGKNRDVIDTITDYIDETDIDSLETICLLITKKTCKRLCYLLEACNIDLALLLYARNFSFRHPEYIINRAHYYNIPVIYKVHGVKILIPRNYTISDVKGIFFRYALAKAEEVGYSNEINQIKKLVK